MSQVEKPDDDPSVEELEAQDRARAQAELDRGHRAFVDRVRERDRQAATEAARGTR